MAKAASTLSRSEDQAKPKRPKTGGRKKKSIDQMLVETRVRAELAGHPDDTDVPAPLAAIYLGISEDTLLELRKPRPDGPFGSHGTEGPPFYKVTLPGAVGNNQTVMYSLGGLREYKKKHTGVTSHEVAIKSNMLGWVAARQPFFAEHQARRGPAVIVAPAWDFDAPDRDELFARAAREEIRVVWLSPAEAASQWWSSSDRQTAFAEPWLAMLAEESANVRSAIDASEIRETDVEAPPRDAA